MMGQIVFNKNSPLGQAQTARKRASICIIFLPACRKCTPRDKSSHAYFCKTRHSSHEMRERGKE